MTIKTLLGFVLTISFLAPIGAQQQQRKRDDIVSTDTNLVQIDVVVTDKAGKQVIDLKPEDFEVSEDGKKRQLTHFSYIAIGKASQPDNVAAANPGESIKTEAPIKPARLNREQVRRTVALVIDDFGLSFESFDFARRALKKFVDEQMQPNDMVAVLRTSVGVGALQQFTSDKRQIHAAIDSVRWNPLGHGGLSPDGTMNEASINADNRYGIQFTEESEETRAGIYSVGTIGAVSAIIKGMAEMPGRKSLLLISEAFQLFTAEGRNVDLVYQLRRLTDEANANSVAIYTIDASGLQSYTFKAGDKVAGYSYVIDPDVMAASGGPQALIGPPSGSSFATAGRDLVGGAPPKDNGPRRLDRADTTTAQYEADSGAAFRRLQALSAMRDQQAGETQTVLSYLAQRTGGMFERNRNDLGTSIERIMQDQQGYYVIGFRPDESSIRADGSRRLHDLKVKVKRFGTKVRSRASYFGIADEARTQAPRTREAQLSLALTSPFGSGDINVQLTSLFRDEPKGGGGYLRSLLHIDAKDLKFTEAVDGTRTAALEMVAVAFGDNGRVVNQVNSPHTVRVANATDYQRTIEQGLVYIMDFPLRKGGPYQMRVVVRDTASERTGAAMQFVEAPELTTNRLALSGIVLSNAVEQDIRSGPAVRKLRQGMMLDYRLIVYNAVAGASEPVEMQMRLLRDGKLVFTGKLVPLEVSKEADPHRISTGGRLRLGPDLTPGNYVLHVAVKNKARVASQWIDFEIVN